MRAVPSIAALLLAVAGARAAWLLHTLAPFEVDDAWITLRYGRLLAAGQGLTWNPGDPPVEGYSNFLYVLFAAAAHAAGVAPLPALKALGIACLAGALIALYRLGRCLLGPAGSAVPVAAVAAYPGTLIWTASGMETPAYLLLAAAAALALARALEGDRRFAAVGGWVFAAALCRSEGPLLLLPLAAGAWIAGRRRGAAALIAAFAIPYAAYTAWRLLHFGQLLPNPVACKVGYRDHPYALLWRFGLTFGWAAPLAAWYQARLEPRRRGLVVALALPALLYGGLMIGLDPVLAYLNRHALAAGALLLIPGTAGGVALSARVLPRVGQAGIERAAALLALAVLVASAPSQRRQHLQLLAEVGSRIASRAAVGDRLAATVGPGDSVLLGACGRIAYGLDARVLDAFCLNYPPATRPPLKGKPAALAEHLLALDPEVLVISSTSGEVLRPLGYTGIFPAIVANPRFADYHLAWSAAADPGQGYFVYMR